MDVFEERFETFCHVPIQDQDDIKWKVLEQFFYELMPFLGEYKSRLEVNILFFDLISTYRG